MQIPHDKEPFYIDAVDGPPGQAPAFAIANPIFGSIIITGRAVQVRTGVLDVGPPEQLSENSGACTE